MSSVHRGGGRIGGFRGFRGIAARVFLSTAAIVAVVLFAALAVASRSGRRAAREAERRGLEQAADLAAQLLAGRGRTLAGGARVFVQGPYFRALVNERRSDDIMDQAFEAADQLDADWVFITDERGVLLAKSDEPGAAGVSMGGIPLVAGALEGRTMSGYGVSRDSLLFQAVAMPIVVPGAAPVGVLVATKIVDRQLARDIHAATGAEIVFYALDARGTPRLAATSIANDAAAHAALPVMVGGAAPGAGSSAPSSASSDAAPDSAPSNPSTDDTPTAAPNATSAAATARIGDVAYVLQGGALTTAGGEPVGGYVVGRPDETMPAELAGVRRSLLVAGLLGLVLALAAAWSAARRVTRPARELAAAAVRALDGDYDGAARTAAAWSATRDASAGAGSAVPDEIATLGGALAALLEELREKRAVVATLDRFVGAPGEGEGSAASLPPSAVTPRIGRATPVAPLGMRGARAHAPSLASPMAQPATQPLQFREPRSAATAALAPGTVVAGRYALAEQLGAGGTGIVYKVTDLTLGETVALKMLRPDLVAADPRAQEELKHELRLTRRVSHRNVVRTYDFGTTGDGLAFITMEYVRGPSLAAVLAHRGALPPEAVLALARQLVRALDAAHEHGVVHGDLKPANVLVAMDGLLKVADFGVATLVRRPPSAVAAAASPATRGASADEPVTPPRLAGAVVGTPEYMAPELLLGGTPDVRADLYAAGMVLHECLTGATPFQRDTPRGFLSQKLDASATPATPPTPTRLAVPAAATTVAAPGGDVGSGGATAGAEPRTLEAVVARMTAPDPDDRPPSAAAVAAILARLG